jgi:hypothetical protein
MVLLTDLALTRCRVDPHPGIQMVLPAGEDGDRCAEEAIPIVITLMKQQAMQRFRE